MSYQQDSFSTCLDHPLGSPVSYVTGRSCNGDSHICDLSLHTVWDPMTSFLLEAARLPPLAPVNSHLARAIENGIAVHLAEIVSSPLDELFDFCPGSCE